MVNTHTPAQIAEAFNAVNTIDEVVVPDFNVGPTRDVPAVLERGKGDEEVRREVRMLRWGLVPFWAKDPSGGSKMINARVETAPTKPAFRDAFARRRCIVAASGFYEWERTDNGKQPWFIHPSDGSILSFAGLYERWKDAEGKLLMSCAVITTSAPDDVGHIHDRAPMVVPSEALDDWLDPAAHDPAQFKSILIPAVPGTFEAYKVDVAVGNVCNNYPELIEPIPDPAPPDRLF